MKIKINYIIIFSVLLVLTTGAFFNDYAKQLGTILADASFNPGHPLDQIEGSENLATKDYVNDAIAGISGSNWTISGSNIYRSSGNVGIGVTNPSVKLHVNGNIIANDPTDSNHVATKKYVDDKIDSSTILLDVCGGETSTVMYSQTYPIKAFGSNCWMTKNVNHYPVPNSGDMISICYNAISSNCTTYGRLYNFNTSYLACGDGWRLPTIDDFLELRDIIGSDYESWIDSNLWAAQLGGSRQNYQPYDFTGLGYFGLYRISSGNHEWRIDTAGGYVTWYGSNLFTSVRCVKK